MQGGNKLLPPGTQVWPVPADRRADDWLPAPASAPHLQGISPPGTSVFAPPYHSSLHRPQRPKLMLRQFTFKTQNHEFLYIFNHLTAAASSGSWTCGCWVCFTIQLMDYGWCSKWPLATLFYIIYPTKYTQLRTCVFCTVSTFSQLLNATWSSHNIITL